MKTRERKCCPLCGCLSIERRIKTKRYYCTKCTQFFIEPAAKVATDVPNLKLKFMSISQ